MCRHRPASGGDVRDVAPEVCTQRRRARRPGESAEHQTEAAEVAPRVGAGTNFGPVLRSYQRRLLGCHARGRMREDARVRELARAINPGPVRSATRRAGYYSDLGRGWRPSGPTGHRPSRRCAPPSDSRRSGSGANPFVREVVIDLRRRTRGDAALGRELRGMAHRMGLAAG